MLNILSDKNVLNNKIITKEETEDLVNKAVIYEVIRVIDGKPVFMKEHFSRMRESLRLSKIMGSINYEDFKRSVELLIKENSYKNLNIRVSYFYDEKPFTLFYFIESYYPSEEEFNEGVVTVTVKLERANPNVKSYQKELKDNVAEIMNENNAFEAILINQDDTVCEGSKSNVFFVKGQKLITSPDSKVLLGVTRSRVISVCEENLIEIEKRIIKFDEIESFDGAFLTGTSNDVLPIRTIDNLKFNSSENDLVKRVSALYLGEIKKELVAE